MAWSVGERKGETKRVGPNGIVELRPSGGKPVGGAARASKPGGARDLAGGMEILELDFLLSIVESTDGDNKNDVTMRKLTFNELLRREQLNEIDSGALKVYSKDERDLYGKDIQCEAMKELMIRTGGKGKLHG